MAKRLKRPCGRGTACGRLPRDALRRVAGAFLASASPFALGFSTAAAQNTLSAPERLSPPIAVGASASDDADASSSSPSSASQPSTSPSSTSQTDAGAVETGVSAPAATVEPAGSSAIAPTPVAVSEPVAPPEPAPATQQEPEPQPVQELEPVTEPEPSPIRQPPKAERADAPIEHEAASQPEPASASTSVAKAPRAVAPTIPVVRNNALQDVQLGETDNLMRIAFVCRQPCAVTQRPDGGYLLEGVDADLRLDLSDRSRHANILVLEAVGDASLILLDTEEKFAASAVRRCNAAQGPATCLDFEVTRREVRAPAPQQQVRRQPSRQAPQEKREKTVQKKAEPRKAARIATAGPTQLRSSADLDRGKPAPSVAPPAPRLASRVTSPSDDNATPILGAAIAPIMRDELDVGFSFDPPSRLAPPSQPDTTPEAVSVAEAPAPASEPTPEPAPEPVIEETIEPAIEPVIEASADAARLDPPADAPFPEDDAAAYDSYFNENAPDAPEFDTPEFDESEFDVAIVDREVVEQSSADFGALFEQTNAALADIRTEASAILGLDVGSEACEEAQARLQADAWALDAMVDVGFCKAVTGETDAADADFERLLAYTPDNYRALVGRALIAARRGETAVAERFFQDALNALPPMAESDRIVDAMRRL